MSVEADYVFNGTRHDFSTQNVNLSYNPATGTNYPYTDVSHLPNPGFFAVVESLTVKRSNDHALQTSFTRRFSQRWQASGTYTLSALKDEDPLPYVANPAAGWRPEQITFAVTPDLGGQYTLAAGDQRHRAVFNGIYDLGFGFQLSGLYFFGSGERFATSYGGDFRNTGGSGGRLRPNGTIVARNSLVGQPLHRTDVRLQRRFRFGGRAGLDAILEVYNLFNHGNY